MFDIAVPGCKVQSDYLLRVIYHIRGTTNVVNSNAVHRDFKNPDHTVPGNFIWFV